MPVRSPHRRVPPRTSCAHTATSAASRQHRQPDPDRNVSDADHHRQPVPPSRPHCPAGALTVAKRSRPKVHCTLHRRPTPTRTDPRPDTTTGPISPRRVHQDIDNTCVTSTPEPIRPFVHTTQPRCMSRTGCSGLERRDHRRRGPVPVLGDDDVRLAHTRGPSRRRPRGAEGSPRRRPARRAGLAQVAHHGLAVGALLRATVQLADRDHRDLGSHASSFSRPGTPRPPAGGTPHRLTGTHQLQMIDDDQAQVVLLLQTPALRGSPSSTCSGSRR